MAGYIPPVFAYDNPDEYIVSCLLEPIKEVDRFTRWPLHITVVPWFEIARLEEAIAAVARVAAICSRFTAVVGDTAKFGPHETVEVNQIISPQLRNIHNLLIGEIENLGGGSPFPQYILQNYRPHVTKKVGRGVAKNQHLLIQKLWLISAAKTEPRISRLKKVKFETELQL